jgi:hypothetical protein
MDEDEQMVPGVCDWVGLKPARSGPFEGPAPGKPPALPGDGYSV